MWAGCALGVALRYLFYAAGAHAYLEERLELSSPMTSHIRLRECLFLLEGGASPYDGSSCHHPPLMLMLLSQFRSAPEIAHFTFIVIVDVLTALLLREIACGNMLIRARAGQFWAEPPLALKDGSPPVAVSVASPIVGLGDLVSPAFVGLSYLLNPFTIGSCLAHSLQNMQHLAICGAVCFAGRGFGSAAAAALAAALYLCPYTSLLLVIPCALLGFVSANGSGVRVVDTADKDRCRYSRSRDGHLVEPGFVSYLFRFTVATAALFCCLIGASLAYTRGHTDFLSACFLAVLTVQDLTPNIGIFWYIFIEMFDRFRTLFLVGFHAHLLFYPVPLYLRLGRHLPLGPCLQSTVAVGIITMFKPYPTASDYGLMLSLMLIEAELLQESEKVFAFLLSGLLFGLTMFPTMSSVWLGRNAGNANFLYNMTLVVNIFGGLLLSEWVKAAMKLRRRQKMCTFCHDIVLEALDAALVGGAAPGEGEAAVADGPCEGAAGDSATGGRVGGLRRRRAA